MNAINKIMQIIVLNEPLAISERKSVLLKPCSNRCGGVSSSKVVSCFWLDEPELTKICNTSKWFYCPACQQFFSSPVRWTLIFCSGIYMGLSSNWPHFILEQKFQELQPHMCFQVNVTISVRFPMNPPTKLLYFRCLDKKVQIVRHEPNRR